MTLNYQPSTLNHSGSGSMTINFAKQPSLQFSPKKTGAAAHLSTTNRFAKGARPEGRQIIFQKYFVAQRR
jgi:hypothetical protein